MTVSNRFERTPWTIIARASAGDDAVRRQALHAFTRMYRPACEAFVGAWWKNAASQHRISAELADEITQGFFVDVVLGRELLATASPEKGRLRTLLCRALENYTRDQWRRHMAREKHESQAARTNGASDQANGRGTHDAIRNFDAAWARAQLTEALARTRERCLTESQRQGWALFERLVLLPAVYGTERPEMRDAVRETGTPDAARGHVLLRETRMRVLQALEEVVSETIDHPGDFAGEIAYIRKLLADGVMARG